MKQFIVVIAVALTVVALGCASTASASAGNSIYKTDFENGAGDWKAMGGKIEVSADVAHSGKNSLKSFERSDTWNDPVLDITDMTATPGGYDVSCWVYVAKDSPVSLVHFTTAQVSGGNTNYIWVGKSVAAEQGNWVKLEGILDRKGGLDKISVYIETLEKTGDFYIDDFEITALPPAAPAN